MHLGTNTIDELLRAVCALDEGNHSLNFGIVGVEIVIVNVEFSGAISVTSGLEGDTNEGLGIDRQRYEYSATISKTYFAENVGEDRGAEGAILIEDFTVNEWKFWLECTENFRTYLQTSHCQMQKAV